MYHYNNDRKCFRVKMQDQFYRSCSLNDLESCIKLIRYVDVNEPNHEGISYLMCAAKNGNFNIINLLLRYGANINYRSKKFGTALTFLCTNLNHPISSRREEYIKCLHLLLRPPNQTNFAIDQVLLGSHTTNNIHHLWDVSSMKDIEGNFIINDDTLRMIVTTPMLVLNSRINIEEQISRSYQNYDNLTVYQILLMANMAEFYSFANQNSLTDSDVRSDMTKMLQKLSSFKNSMDVRHVTEVNSIILSFIQ